MTKIQIYETDKSEKITSYDPTMNAVFIPGFSNKADAPSEPTLCTSISEFEEKFGKNAYQFTKTQSISDKDIISANGYDLGYIYAKELLGLGLYVYYDAIKSNETESNILADWYNKLPNELNKLKDKNAYNVKFITLGGYPSFGITTGDKNSVKLDEYMLTIATERGDALALIDYVYNDYDGNADSDDVKTVIDLFKEVNTSYKDIKLISTGPDDHSEDPRNYGAMFASWGKYKLKQTTIENDFILPGSFGYLSCFATSVQSNPNYYAVAGVTRGLLTNLSEPTMIINGMQADDIQPDTQDTSKDNYGIAINPITNINPYGYTIWGNRTLHQNTVNGLSASSFLNIRLMSIDVKKIVRDAALKLNFELISDILWLNFKSLVEPQLDKIVSNNGLERYKITRVETDDKATVKAKITLYCTYAVEKWDIEIELTDSYVSVE